MNIDAFGMFVISTAVGLISTIFWRWVSGISDVSKDNANRIEAANRDLTEFKLEVSQKYQSKADAHRDMQLIMDMFREIKSDIKELGIRLEKKMDKTP